MVGAIVGSLKRRLERGYSVFSLIRFKYSLGRSRQRLQGTTRSTCRVNSIELNAL
ncbi:hypothetical protein TRP8649_01468 [Pelagimonas phthalicica]|uniref:Uncharacterized protein n=1 Tax=Pelagimonas phthalicica TaxID=1037362 RepID=A0A238JAF5_9RHOB|nr:hypothetical protein CLV87_0604 [Pelagimonas phthalicica]SMX27363.1 hypothetical protein TRP8649_01468 [Pelagimonas phthalicica]